MKDCQDRPVHFMTGKFHYQSFSLRFCPFFVNGNCKKKRKNVISSLAGQKLTESPDNCSKSALNFYQRPLLCGTPQVRLSSSPFAWKSGQVPQTTVSPIARRVRVESFGTEDLSRRVSQCTYNNIAASSRSEATTNIGRQRNTEHSHWHRVQRRNTELTMNIRDTLT